MTRLHTARLDASAYAAKVGLFTSPPLLAEDLIPASRRAVIVAPHPDDEVLGVGGLLAALSRLEREILLVAVTDGTASHPVSSYWTPQRLAATRPKETLKALAMLGACDISVTRGGFPDGAVASHESELGGYLRRLLNGDDIVLSTWRRDGHPDHESVGRATAWACDSTNSRFIEFPVWRGYPGAAHNVRLPSSRARALARDPETTTCKRHAMAAFASQLTRDPSTGSEPILSSGQVARLVCVPEVVLL